LLVPLGFQSARNAQLLKLSLARGSQAALDAQLPFGFGAFFR
jgi:hypothetical protein